jgi:hypothetical protein
MMNKLLCRKVEYSRLLNNIKYHILCYGSRQVSYFSRVDVGNNVHAELFKPVSYRAHILNFTREKLDNE